MKATNTETFDEKSGGKQKNYIGVLRKNLDAIMDERDLTIKELAEMADIPFETLRNFLYDKEAKDCRLSTVIKLAQALDVPVGLLIGSLKEKEVEIVKTYRSLPQSSQSLIDWHIMDQDFMHKSHNKAKMIKVMLPICSNNGNLKRTYDYEGFDTSGLDEELYHKVFQGIKIPCEHYLPHYRPNDILLLANDRDAMRGENTVIIIEGNVLITRRVIENGQVVYYGIRNGVEFARDSEMVQVVGYIAKVISE